jgi:ferredoxin-NADP reductase
MSVAPVRMSDGMVSELDVVVTRSHQVADGIRVLHLQSEAEMPLPGWSPGAHIDLELPSGRVRQYSLCGSVENTRDYRIAVRLDPQGRGGSAEVHTLGRGARLCIRTARNNFVLGNHRSYLFVAGGIGVTPLLPMVAEVARRKAQFTFFYVVRNQGCLAFVDEIRQIAPSLRIVLTDEAGLPSMESILQAHPSADVYCCGPAPMLQSLERAAVADGRLDDIHVERFTREVDTDGSGATIRCVQSGVTVHVSPGESFLEGLRRAGFDLPSSCEMGICGTCEISVVSGIPDHRDTLLTETERQAGIFLPCVSRSNSAELAVAL